MKTCLSFVCALCLCCAVLGATSTPALAADAPRVVVLLEGALGDKGSSDALQQAVNTVKDELGVAATLIVSTDSDTLEQAFMRAVKEQPLLIICAGITPHTLLMNHAGNYRRQRFIAFEGYFPAENITSLLFYDAQGAFVSGYAAAAALTAQQTQGGEPVCAFVGDRDSTANRLMADAYRDGIKAHLPQTRVINTYTHSAADVAAGHTTALRVLGQGAQVLMAAAGRAGLGVLAAAQEQKAYAIGTGQDQHAVAPRAVLVSYVKNMHAALTQCVSQALHGTLESRGLLEMTLQNNGISVVPNPQLPPALRDAVTTGIAQATDTLTRNPALIPVIKPAQGCNCR